jgi:hypothetical protein
MLSLPGYRITEELHAGAKTLIYRGYREQDQCPVIFKTPTDEYPTQKAITCLQHEYALTKDWDENSQLRDQLQLCTGKTPAHPSLGSARYRRYIA